MIETYVKTVVAVFIECMNILKEYLTIIKEVHTLPPSHQKKSLLHLIRLR